MRGMESNHTMVAINGVAIKDHSTTGGLHDIGADFIKHVTGIQVVKGSQGTLYGANAVGGVINFITTDSFANSISTTVGSNNTKGITTSYHSGGLKMTQAQSVTLRRVRASFNTGPGLWFDVNNSDITVEDCTVIGNSDAGIFMEISRGPCLIRNNLAMNNPTGIMIAETDNCTVINNTCVRNERGFRVRYMDRKGREQARKAYAGNKPLSTDRQEAQGAYTVRNLVVRNNIFAFNTKTQLDAARFMADSWRDARKNNYQSDHNLLWAGPGEASLVNWQTGPVHDLAAWPEHTHYEQHSIVADPTFLAEGPYDFRLPPTSPAAQAGAKPAVPFPDRFGRQQLLPSAGAIQPVLHGPWASRTLKGKGETHIWPLPN